MNLILQYIINNVKAVLAFVVAFVGVLFFRQHKNLEIENIDIKRQSANQKKVIDVQNKVIQITNNTTDTDLAGIVDRMHKKEL